MLPPREPLELLPELLPVERVPLDEPKVLVLELVEDVPYERPDDDEPLLTFDDEVVPRLDDVDVPLPAVFFEPLEVVVLFTLFAVVVVPLLVVVVVVVVVVFVVVVVPWRKLPLPLLVLLFTLPLVVPLFTFRLVVMPPFTVAFDDDVPRFTVVVVLLSRYLLSLFTPVDTVPRPVVGRVAVVAPKFLFDVGDV